MEIAIDSNEVLAEPAARHRLACRIQRVFSRLRRFVSSMHMTIEAGQPNAGSKRRKGKHCKLRIELADGRQMVVQGSGNRTANAVFDTIRRARRLIISQTKRRKHVLLPVLSVQQQHRQLGLIGSTAADQSNDRSGKYELSAAV